MRHPTGPRHLVSLGLAFAAGVALMPASRLLPGAWAQAPAPTPAPSASTTGVAAPLPLVPTIIDIAALKESDLGATAFPDLRAKGFVATPNATLAVQIGSVAKHLHANTDEIQYIVEGTGTAWLGGEKREIRPGMLIVVPRGTPHAGNEATSGKFKTIAIKIPPQGPTDQTFLN